MKYLKNSDGNNTNRIIITAIGLDRVGIIAGITGVLAAHNVNILDISQTVMQEYLVMVLIVDNEHGDLDLAALKDRLDEKGAEIGVLMDAQHEDVFKFMHRL